MTRPPRGSAPRLAGAQADGHRHVHAAFQLAGRLALLGRRGEVPVTAPLRGEVPGVRAAEKPGRPWARWAERHRLGKEPLELLSRSPSGLWPLSWAGGCLRGALGAC